MQKSIRISYTLASIICLGLIIGVLFAPMYPCGYWDKAHLYEDYYQAGYGHQSFIEVVGNGFFWEADEVPESFESYIGDTTNGYYAMGLWWISLFYIPLLLGIIYLGWLITGGKERLSVFLPGCKEYS
jgi:hypothetical protein